MPDFHYPNAVAAAWQRAADKVITLKRDDLSGAALESWNAAIEHAAGVLENEARDADLMARMAHLLVVGNLHENK